ncbi:MAG: diaminohydroxyphosphoribosylaminopyrimidine deaminase [Fimbriimonadaceae bacterium]|jgi:diaminohydroxyphosphoribosylaminopyrimidine deaminase/5-amino-6-(5-phosphoribosylamino)uracil reductase|nr:diaminohydroxyphosphoribosylaminopyrimidine deaminase [Fimbriimonadaceae bacterium]
MSSAEEFMRRAVELSLYGYPAPNPRVGCVIVQKGEVVGDGYHDHAGGRHAEVVALEQAGDRARGADVYVTLEPCNHHGRTPPCVDALIAAQVASVTVGCLDPNPVASGGLSALKQAGIRVESGVLEAEVRKTNEVWLTAVERQSPYVVGKVAMSLDGRVAMPDGESKWITSEASRQIGHVLRAECGAVMVGKRTVSRDNPLLTARVPGVVNQPVRIVLDPNSALLGIEKVFGDEAPTWHVVKHPVLEGHVQAPMRDNLIDLRELLADFYRRGVTSLLIEGGPITLGHFLREGLVDRLEVFVAPKALGAGPSWLEGGVANLADAHKLPFERVKQVGPDIWITCRPSVQ